MLKIAIDLDETLISNNHYTGDSWRLKRSARKYLKHIQTLSGGIEFHLITGRNELFYPIVLSISKQIEKQIGVKFETVNCTNGETKGPLASSLGCEFLIDDCVDYFSDCHLQKPSVLPLWFGVKKKSKTRGLQFPVVTCLSWREVYLHIANHIEQNSTKLNIVNE